MKRGREKTVFSQHTSSSRVSLSDSFSLTHITRIFSLLVLLCSSFSSLLLKYKKRDETTTTKMLWKWWWCSSFPSVPLPTDPSILFFIVVAMLSHSFFFVIGCFSVNQERQRQGSEMIVKCHTSHYPCLSRSQDTRIESKTRWRKDHGWKVEGMTRRIRQTMKDEEKRCQHIRVTRNRERCKSSYDASTDSTRHQHQHYTINTWRYATWRGRCLLLFSILRKEEKF